MATRHNRKPGAAQLGRGDPPGLRAVNDAPGGRAHGLCPGSRGAGRPVDAARGFAAPASPSRNQPGHTPAHV